MNLWREYFKVSHLLQIGLSHMTRVCNCNAYPSARRCSHTLRHLLCVPTVIHAGHDACTKRKSKSSLSKMPIPFKGNKTNRSSKISSNSYYQLLSIIPNSCLPKVQLTTCLPTAMTNKQLLVRQSLLHLIDITD